MAEEEKDGALAPAEPAHTPLSEIVDKPRISEPPAKAITDEPVRERQERKPKADKPDDEVRIRGLIRETIEEREKRQALERERDQYKRAWEDHQRKLAVEQDRDPAPDMFRDPNAYNQWVERQVQKRAESIAKQQFAPVFEQVSQQQLRLSEMTAEKHLGPEKWKKLNEWIEKQGDQFKAWATSQPDPYFAAYDQYRQRTTFERLGNDDIDTLIEKEVAKRLAAQRGPIDAPDGDIEEDDADPARDTGGRFTGPKPLGAILAEKSPNRRKR